MIWFRIQINFLVRPKQLRYHITDIWCIATLHFSVHILLHFYAHIITLPVGDKSPTFHPLIVSNNISVRKRNMIDFGQPNGTVGVSFQFDRRFLGNFVGETRRGNYAASAPDVDGSIGIAYITEIED